MADRQSAFGSTAVAVIAFAVAMGYLEATVVVYLRGAIESSSVGPVPDATTIGGFRSLEIVREVATLVMVAAVGWLAGQRRLERLAWAAVIFGLWDVVYYVGLRLAIGWPPSADTWDVLFLVPIPWVGPVWAPMAVSVALVASGLLAARRLRKGLPIRVRPIHAAAALAGGGLVILSFLADSSRVLGGDLSPWTGWAPFWAGMALAGVATAAVLTGGSGEAHDATLASRRRA